MATRKNTSLKNGFPVDPGFNFRKQLQKIDREQEMKKKKKKVPSVDRSRARRVG